MKKLVSVLIIILSVTALIKGNLYEENKMLRFEKAGMLKIAGEDQKNLGRVITGEIEEVKLEYSVQTYWDFYDLPFKSLAYVDDSVYEALKQMYAQIDFTSEFKKGDRSSYDFYIKKYRQFVNNEVPFYDAGQDAEYYLNQYGQLEDREHDPYDLDKHTYFLFDMDGDDYPELGVTEYMFPETKTKKFFYIFKYDVRNDRMILWFSTESTYSWMIGSGKVGWQNCRYYYLDQLDSNGEIRLTTKFVRDAFFTNGELLYLVTSPWYKDEDAQLPVTESMKRQGYYAETEEWFYFRVTEEQFEELTERFFQAEKESWEKIEEVSYTYEELFADDEQEKKEDDLCRQNANLNCTKNSKI